MGLAFVGGVHGVGKSTACVEVASAMGLRVHTASAVIRSERELPDSDQGKLVADVKANQQLLIRGVRKLLAEGPGLQILDGHFALRTLHESIECIGVDVFDQLCVQTFVCYQDDPAAILRRLRERDAGSSTVAEIAALQDAEIRHAKLVARRLSRPLHLLMAFDSESLKRLLARAINE